MGSMSLTGYWVYFYQYGNKASNGAHCTICSFAVVFQSYKMRIFR